LGEDTGMLITEGDKMEAIGSGLVVIIDGMIFCITILVIFPMATRSQLKI
jgi:hypothetical protein